MDNIIYTMLVVDYSNRVSFGASILMEALSQHVGTEDGGLANGKVVLNDTARIEPEERGAVYGRRITMDLLNNGGRSVTTFYFYRGKLYEQSATILPANGDYATPYSTRFVESLLFNLTRLKDEADGEAVIIPEGGMEVLPFEQ